jgi:hypothetical protein
VWIAVLLVAVIAAVAVGIALAQNHGSSGPSTFHPGTPTLHSKKLENDMQNIEKLVQR